MNPRYAVSTEAEADLFEIWRWIAAGSVDLANRVEEQFFQLFEPLAQSPGIGHTRKDLTGQPVLFFPLYSFLVVYRADATVVQIVAILRGKRNLRRV